MTEAEAQAFLDQLARDQAAQNRSAPVQAGDVADLMRRNPEDVEAVMAAYTDQYARRGATTDHRAFDSQSGAYSTNADPRTEPGYGVVAQRGTYAGLLPSFQNQYAQRYAMTRPNTVPILGQTQPGVSTTNPVSSQNQYRDRILAYRQRGRY